MLVKLTSQWINIGIAVSSHSHCALPIRIGIMCFLRLFWARKFMENCVPKVLVGIGMVSKLLLAPDDLVLGLVEPID